MKKLRLLLLVTVILVGYQLPLQAQNGEKLFREGMMKEEGAGNLDEAIDIYYKVVNDVSANRALRAKALMHVGICYEKLGKKNAKNTYQKLIAEYADQTAIVAMVRKKLRSLKVDIPKDLKSGLITQHLQTVMNDKFFSFRVSPNGQQYAFVDYEKFEIMIHDFATEKSDSITQGNTWFTKKGASNPSNPIWSPNGNKIAYVWKAENVKEVRIVDKNGENSHVILSGSHAEIPNINTFTRDGQYILGTMEEGENNEKVQNLVMISIVNKKFKILKSFGKQTGTRFSFSPGGKYLLFSKDQGVYVMSMTDLSETTVANSSGQNKNPVWSLDGSSILFLSNRMGTTDLYKVKFGNGKIVGEEKIVKKNLGNRVKIIGVSKDKSIYYTADNSRYDIFTLNLEEKFKNNITKSTRITDLALRSGGLAPRFSKDGKYISYVNEKSNYKSSNGSTFDKELGDKYFIGIYDVEKKEHHELNTEIYGRDDWSIDEFIPDWSYEGSKLLIKGRIRDNYQFGYMAVDTKTEKITPLLTVSNNKESDEYGIGHFPVFSQDKNKIYYTSQDWKNLMEYNLITKKKNSLFYHEPGFWFGGFSKDESKFAFSFKGGVHIYSFLTKELKKVSEFNKGRIFGWSTDEKYLYLRDGHIEIKTITRIAIDGNDPDKIISMKEIFPYGKSWMITMHPTKDVAVFDLKINNGLEIFKLSGAFD